MGYDYALVHLYYTIPPAIILSLLYRPLLTSVDVYKILFLITVAVAATIPWDSYLIRTNVWSYPPDAIVGPTFLDIPAEELFFFVIQTYNTTLLYLAISKPTFHPAYLEAGVCAKRLRRWAAVGAGLLVGFMGYGWTLVLAGAEGFYMGLIIVWAGPFIFLLWALAYQFLIKLPVTNTVYPIAIPTLYLWVVDTIALRRGTWVIESGTKLGIQLWEGLEVEEAFFFFATNCLIVFGLVAFDHALAIMAAFPAEFPDPQPALASPDQLFKSLLISADRFDETRIRGFRDALARLRAKSRSFYLASGAFGGRLRIDLVLLYSFCRVADDLIDDADGLEEARQWVEELHRFLDHAYGTQRQADLKRNNKPVDDFISKTFPPETHAALRLLPTSYLSSKPFYDLLKGFEMDLQFKARDQLKELEQKKDPDHIEHSVEWPITDAETLELYGARVAGTVAESCIELAYYHSPGYKVDEQTRSHVLRAGRLMGIALQIVNIARDIAVDAAIERLYIPLSWLSELNDDEKVQLTPEDIVNGAPNWDPESRTLIEGFRQRLLARAFEIYRKARPSIEELPPAARAPMRVAVESYMEIGRVLKETGQGRRVDMKRGRATVPKWRRIKVAWNALQS